MDIVNLKEKLQQQLFLIKSALTNATQLKTAILFSIKNLEEELTSALQKPKNCDEIAEIKERLEEDRCAYANCELHIITYQADSVATKIEIIRLERRLKKYKSMNKKIWSNFYRKEKDDSDNDEFQVSSDVCQSSQTCPFMFHR